MIRQGFGALLDVSQTTYARVFAGHPEGVGVLSGHPLTSIAAALLLDDVVKKWSAAGFRVILLGEDLLILGSRAFTAVDYDALSDDVELASGQCLHGLDEGLRELEEWRDDMSDRTRAGSKPYSQIPPAVPAIGSVRTGFRFAGFEFAAVGGTGVRVRISEHTMERIRRSIRRATETGPLPPTAEHRRRACGSLTHLLGSVGDAPECGAAYRYLLGSWRNRETALQVKHLDRFLQRRLARFLGCSLHPLEYLLQCLAKPDGLRPRTFGELQEVVGRHVPCG